MNEGCLQAILTLFELGTLDNWGDSLFAAMDITGLDKQPRRNAEWQNAIFFIVFICVSAHFMIKSFVAVFCEQVSLISGLFTSYVEVNQRWNDAVIFDIHSKISSNLLISDDCH